MDKPGIVIIVAGLLFLLPVFRSASFAEDQVQALIDAACKGDLKQTQDLLDKGADVNVKGMSGQTPIAAAAQQGHAGVVRLLLEKGADVNSRVDAGFTPLIEAANLGHLEVTKVLLDRGADVNTKDGWGGTALITAARQDHPEIVKLLLERGADINAKDRKAWTALDWGVWNSYPEIVTLLLESGAGVDEKDSHGRTMLMEAVARPYQLKTREDSPWYCGLWNQALNLLGFTVWGPIEPPSGERDPEIVKLLLEHGGADINAKDKDDWTALKRAKKRGSKEIVELLKAHGAKE